MVRDKALFFLHWGCMSEMRIDCPHCGTSFEVQIDGEPSNMMVFCCARCKTPLMYFHGVISELDREEFANLRKRLTRALDAVASRDSGMAEVADAIRKIVEESELRAEERAETHAAELSEERSEEGSVQRSAPGAPETSDSAKVVITDDMLDSLQQDLDNLDAESFLDKI